MFGEIMRLVPSRLLRFVAVGLAALASFSASAVSPDVVISQVYGGGGNSGATYTNDFIELHNRGSSTVNLSGWSVQYAPATGSSWQTTALTGVTLQPGQYYLVQEAAGAGGTTALPTPDATGSIALSGTAGKVALVADTTALTCGGSAAACASVSSIRDFVGFGSTATTYEGSSYAPAPSNTTSVLRASNGCTDTDNNSTDFATGAPAPRNTASAISLCSGLPVNGACGTANGQSLTSIPTANLCSTGTSSAVSGSGPWTWSCAGSNGGSTASCSARKNNGAPFTIFHMNDIHARVTPHDWVIPAHGNNPQQFEKVGGAAYVAGKMLSLVGSNPNALVLDGGDISEGNPVGDMNGTSTTSYGNGGLTGYLSLLANKLKAVPGRPTGRGIDALVVGNHDVRDASYITNMEQMHTTGGIPVISANVRDIGAACNTSHPRYPTCEHFPATTTVTSNGTKIGIIGYTTPSAVVGASLTATLNVVQCDWKGSIASGCHIADYVNDLRNNQGCDVVILLTHDGHSDLVDPTTPVLADTADAKVPELAITGHWHTWAETVWQPVALNYKTMFAESASYMKYIGELNVDATGKYVSATQHVLRNTDITPDADIQTYVNNLIVTYDANTTGHKVNDVVGYTADALMLDDAMKWWSADEYPWSGNNTAGQWITDAMKWKCDQIAWPSGGGCDLAVEAGGGVRADIPAGPVTWKQVYETFPWADDTYVRVSMTGQDIVNFLKATNLDAGFSSELDVTAFDGITTSVLMNGSPIGLSTVYKVAINNYMWLHPPGSYTWPTGASPENINTTTGLATFNTDLVRNSLAEFMTAKHSSTPYQVGGDRYHFNGSYSGGYRVVVTMMNDADSSLTYDDAFVRFLSANPETLARRGTKQVPASLVNADGSINAANRFSEQELYRSYLGFKTGALKPGDIIEVWGKASFYGGNPEFVDQEGIYGDGVEFKIVGHDDSLAKPVLQKSITALLTDDNKNHYVKFLAKKSATANTVTDQFNQTLKIWDKTGYAAKTLPGNTGDVLEISGVLTMESFGFRFRADSATVSTASLPSTASVTSKVDPLTAEVSGTVTLSATASINGGGYSLAPVADAQVASGNPSTNYGSSTNLYVQSSASGYGNERGWLKFDLSGIPAGTTISGASLQLWNWKSTGAALPVEVRSATDDTWTETGLNWTTQPALGSVLDTQTLASGTTNLSYSWNVTSFVQSQFGGDKTVSLMLKAVTEGSADATAPSYGFDAKEYGSNAPVLVVTTSATATSVANVKFYYRYSSDNVTWGAWTQTGATDTAAPYNTSFSFPSGAGYYEFYSVATDNLGGVESTPAYAQTAVHYQAASGATQTITFPQPANVTVGNGFSVSASASSGLLVSLVSQTSSVCAVSGDVVSTSAKGTCTIAAAQAGDPGYWLPASLARSFTVLGIAQTISFPSIGNRQLGSGPVVLNATSSATDLSVSYASLSTSVCTVSGSTVTLLAVGTCTIAADQPGDATRSAAPTVTQSFSVSTASGGGSGGSDTGDVPLPGWALAALAAGLAGAMRRNGSKQARRGTPL
jgi:2',3'-cyclic-nucleotide 2'-phosphodiesterase / 3'-nucleotidase / 5'-nucleotidase